MTHHPSFDPKPPYDLPWWKNLLGAVTIIGIIALIACLPWLLS